AKRRDRDFVFLEDGHRNGVLHGKGTKRRAVGRKNPNEIRAAVRHVDPALGIHVAVLAESNQAVSCGGAPRSRGFLADGQELLSRGVRSEEHTSELQSRGHLVCRLLLEKKKKR